MPVTSSPPVDDGTRELVTPSLERVLQRRDERAELRCVRPGYIWETSRIRTRGA